MRLISTTSSATSRWPRSMRSSAHSDLPTPLSPMISTPRPKTSMSTECRWRRVASRSSRKAESCLMKGVDSRGVARTGMPRASAADRSSVGGTSPLVTTKQEMRQRHEPGQDERPPARRQLAQVADLAAAQDLHAPVADVVGVAGEGQPRPLHAREVDALVEARAAPRRGERQAGCAAAPGGPRTATPGRSPRRARRPVRRGPAPPSGLRLDQPQVAVLAAVEHVDALGGARRGRPGTPPRGPPSRARPRPRSWA